LSVETPGQALDAVEQALSDPHARSASRRAVAADLFYKPGTATARAVDELYDAMELAPAAATATVPRRAAVL
jgi:hypothetical protein